MTFRNDRIPSKKVEERFLLEWQISKCQPKEWDKRIYRDEIWWRGRSQEVGYGVKLLTPSYKKIRYNGMRERETMMWDRRGERKFLLLSPCPFSLTLKQDHPRSVINQLKYIFFPPKKLSIPALPKHEHPWSEDGVIFWPQHPSSQEVAHPSTGQD